MLITLVRSAGNHRVRLHEYGRRQWVVGWFVIIHIYSRPGFTPLCLQHVSVHLAKISRATFGSPLYKADQMAPECLPWTVQSQLDEQAPYQSIHHLSVHMSFT